MGAIYKRKLRSCKMCKPHKMGWAKKNTIKIRQFIELTDEELKNLTNAGNESKPANVRKRK